MTMPPSAAAVQGEKQRALMLHLMSGEATFLALEKAVHDLVSSAPEDHDVIVHAFNIYVDKIGFIEPHSLLLSGFDQEGNHTSVVAHYSQMVARVIYIKKREPEKERVITGFWRSNDGG
jgi:hypothetical protein